MGVKKTLLVLNILYPPDVAQMNCFCDNWETFDNFEWLAWCSNEHLKAEKEGKGRARGRDKYLEKNEEALSPSQ